MQQAGFDDYRFTDDEIIWSFSELHYVAALPPSPQIAHALGESAVEDETAALPANIALYNDPFATKIPGADQHQKKRSPIGCC
ncbi:hypothetical protein BG74_04485 [Sodalis-like endosymbiont of Proechinophthirus fluctus]|uniref:hypothetical protein n=1 Tax=Sodalis-like endosymbiont of Proechinophthirus fluctus TaxID=1462730 RepID=UPI0007A930E8|nr:hypothetical protein [Sodalis-like endosymbiont of Proechinophthirus fluctus]KYP97230.1 hypothetical protein BG74_04485 [Sodalis-like endosymbiont of Proechinophthirus fluctus]